MSVTPRVPWYYELLVLPVRLYNFDQSCTSIIVPYVHTGIYRSQVPRCLLAWQVGSLTVIFWQFTHALALRHEFIDSGFASAVLIDIPEEKEEMIEVLSLLLPFTSLFSSYFCISLHLNHSFYFFRLSLSLFQVSQRVLIF